MTDLIGTSLGQYEFKEIIRRGGMSTVYKAYQDSLDRFVAVKVLFTSRDPQFAARFKREARAIAALQHHNILPVYDYGEQEGMLYLVLQYIENGTTLGDMLGQPLEPVTALRLSGHVLDALDYAHKRGVIHRDIKPANVLMPSPNWPMLADFGIAKLMNDNQQRLTLANQIIGTAAYMAPEQATGRPIDARTDLYAAGVVLYELVTGRVPFDSDTPMAVLTKHVYEPPPPARSLNPDVAPAVEALLQKALSKDPNARFQTASEMAEELRHVATQIAHDPKRSQVTGLYQVGLQAFEQGHWDEAVNRLGQLISLDPEYEDASELLDAAREAQERAKEEARQRIELVRQQRQSSIQQIRPATEATPPVEQQAGTPRTAVLKTTKLPELDIPAAQPPATHPTTAVARQATAADAAPAARSTFAPSTQQLPEQVAVPGGAASPPAASGRKLPIALIVAGVVVLALIGALVVFLNGARQAGPTGAATAAVSRSTDSPATTEPAGAPTAADAPTQAQPVDAAPAPEPTGKLVFQDDFNSKASQSGLEDNLGAPDFSRGFHSPGVYHIIPKQPANAARWVLLPRQAYGNFSMQLKVFDASDELSGNLLEGVTFRARDTEHFYALLLDPRNGKYSVRKYNGTSNVTDLIAPTASALVSRQKDINLIRVDAKDDTFTIYLNGKLLDTFKDGDYSFGMLGMIADSIDAVKPHPHYDDLSIWSDDQPAKPTDLAAEKQDPAGDMVLIAGGEFIMGGNERGDAQTNIVGLPSFYIDRTEVTNAAYKQCIAAGKCSAPRQDDSPTHPDYFPNDAYASYPVMYVTWEQARQFCGWAGKRLPTEAEWEKAASWNSQARTKALYPFGNAFDAKLLNSAESGSLDTAPVGQFPPEINGTVDMAGNLSEWTSSLFKPYPYNEADGREEAPAPGERVFRGGSWAQTEGKAKVYDRRSAPPDYSDREISFRCAATP
ncbi:MAG: SUMF1/EgtB/PvdO family nonheme iron enzyme [Kouleothrix sp.]|nr:SUMF1/EgtB/PvdO family nonheme iron enzyme [Kouleothrix sp.]